MLNRALIAFNTAFEQIPNPEKAIKFLNNLLKAAQQVPGLAVELRDGKFLDALIQFGLTASQLNMTEATGTETLWFFLDTLWNADGAGEIRLGARQLSEFFKQAETSEKRLKLLEFSDNLLQAAKLAPTLQQQVKDPRFVDALLGLGGAYAAIDPIVEPHSQDSSFLDTLWNLKNNQSLTKGADEVEAFLRVFKTTAEKTSSLAFGDKVLTALKPLISSEDERSSSYIFETLDFARDYANAQINKEIDEAG